MTARTKKQEPMCCLTIGVHDYLMPMTAGMKVMQLLSAAVPVDREYRSGRGTEFEVTSEEAQRMHLEPVMPNQVRWPAETVVPTAPRRRALARPEA